MEYLAIYDQTNEPLGRILPRPEVHALGYWHRTSQIYVWHPQKGFLCHLRSAIKDLFPSLWDISIGGHLNPDETYQSCASRELSEELGIKVQPEELQFVTIVTIDGQDEKAQLLDREHAGIFLYKTLLEAPSFNYQKEEVEQVAYISITELRADLQSLTPNRKYIPLQSYFLNILDQLEVYLQQEE